MKFYYQALPVVVGSLFAATSAQAASINFNFLVNSSGSDIYACDAGIYDPYDPVNLPGTYGRGSAAQSSIQASVGTYNNGNPVALGPVQVIQSNIVLPPVAAFHTVAYPFSFVGPTVIDRLNTVIANPTLGDVPNSAPIANATDAGRLTFNLASDYYGASYFVDFCYRGSKLPYSAARSYDYSVKDSVSAMDLFSGSYLTDADLDVGGKLVCEPRTASTSENWGVTAITDTFAAGLTGLGGTGTQTSTIGLADFTGAVQNVFGTSAAPLSFSLIAAPAKYCVIRYVFKEKSTAKRKWDINTANFTIDLTVKNVSRVP